ncbi:hypothetical protein M758_10G079600 [Ceratodon purpureus]|uniref:Uncharacterized protein n=1 Tax=Ceratodon purpureus TaxID=3225 RepID=A0A8T0GJD9_CERPU|nr:hypothetical protein KC19_10G080800 [Ceratodon purpureus]KAG0603257.1 hypothetical protein M758_10G079600 [Ceratodon purpureus]
MALARLLPEKNQRKTRGKPEENQRRAEETRAVLWRSRPTVWTGDGGVSDGGGENGDVFSKCGRVLGPKELQQTAPDPPPSLLIALEDLYPPPPLARPATTLRLSLASTVAPASASLQSKSTPWSAHQESHLSGALPAIPPPS